MHKPKRKVCECGRTYWTSVEFGNETKCDACYQAHKEEFLAWMDSLPDDEHRALCERIRAVGAALGVTVPQTTPAAEPANDQDDIDATFLDIMRDINI